MLKFYRNVLTRKLCVQSSGELSGKRSQILSIEKYLSKFSPKEKIIHHPIPTSIPTTRNRLQPQVNIPETLPEEIQLSKERKKHITTQQVAQII